MMLFDGIYAYVWGNALKDSSNTYILKDDTTIIIDPGCFKTFVNLFGLMRNDGMEISDVDVVMNTHLHKDHCETNRIFLEKGSLLAFNPLEKVSSQFEYNADIDLSKTRYYNSGKFNLEIIHTPGHTPGSSSIHIEEFSAIITGDILFENGLPGRTDLLGGNTKQLIKTLEKLQDLEPEFILPGHGRIFSGKEGIKILIEKAIQIITERRCD